jgi:HAD superfamily hydrolase (TIGR01662 family)
MDARPHTRRVLCDRRDERGDYSIVVPTIGRSSLWSLLEALEKGEGPRPLEVVVVDDRRDDDSALQVPDTALPVRVLRGKAAGPAAARNIGWRAASGAWICFLDDDVVPSRTWRADLCDDLDGLPEEVGGSQGGIEVPLTARRPTDWERNTKGLESACWATADLAYRRTVLEEVDGFDERFPRAFREDSDLGLRVESAGYFISRGSRHVLHPVRKADRWVSLRLQSGNADDSLMLAIHGPNWRWRAGAEPGRTARHLITTLAAAASLVRLSRGRRSEALRPALVWLALTAELAWTRIAPGPASVDEISTMLTTSAVLPFVASFHWLRGWLCVPYQLKRTEGVPLGRGGRSLALSPQPVWVPRARRPRNPRVDPSWEPKAVLFDRDGTLVVDVPYNSDPGRVALMPGARRAVARVRDAGLRVGVVTNQSGVARGKITQQEVEDVHRRIEDLIGPVDTWAVCTHGRDEGCSCRKPASGLIYEAASALGLPPSSCAVVGDIGTDVDAALTAGARAVLVPTPLTAHGDVVRAPAVAPNVLSAVDMILAGTC